MNRAYDEKLNDFEKTWDFLQTDSCLLTSQRMEKKPINYMKSWHQAIIVIGCIMN